MSSVGRELSRRLGYFVRLSRPHFLMGGAIMYTLGAVSATGINAGRFVGGQMLVTTAQLAAHFLNEYADREVDRSIANRTLFSGGSGVLTGGMLRPRIALVSGIVASALSLAIAAWFLPEYPLTAFLGVGAVSISWLYSMPPARLLGTGWGELATTVVVVGAVPMIGVTSQGSGPPPALWASIAVLLPYHFATMLAFEVPDIRSDREVGKHVLAVRIGRRHTEQLIVALQVTGACLVTAALVSGWLATGAALAYLAVFPAWVGFKAFKHDRFGRATGAGVATLVVAAVALIIGLV